jgi:hypothetical protein
MYILKYGNAYYCVPKQQAPKRKGIIMHACEQNFIEHFYFEIVSKCPYIGIGDF